MSIRFRTGNLLDSDAQALVNTVNCVGVMGKGIALQFRRRYPHMHKRYVELCKQGDVRLGKPYVDRDLGRTIINFPTKDHWKGRSRIADVRSGLRYLRQHLQEWGISSLAIPPLGCGNGGLDWKDVRPIIVQELADLPVDVEVYEPMDGIEQEQIGSHSDAAISEPPQLSLFNAPAGPTAS